MATTEPKKTPENPARLARRMRDANVPPHTRVDEWRMAWGLDDGELAEVLEVSRPDVHRVRTGARPASFTLAVRIEAVMGIPASAWREVPHNVALRANWYALDAKPKRRKG